MVQYYKRKVIYSNGSVHYKYYKLYSNGRMVKVLKYEYMKGQCAKSKTGGVPPLDLTKGYQGDSFQKYYIEYMSTDNINSTKYTGIEAKIAMEFERVYVDLYNKNIMNETGCNMDNYRKASDIDKAAMNELNKKMALYFYTIATIQYPRILYKNFEFLVHNIYKNGRFINNFDKLYKDITKLHIDKECIYLFHAIRANPKIIEQQYVDMKLDTAPVKYLPDDLKIICENGLNPDVVDAGSKVHVNRVTTLPKKLQDLDKKVKKIAAEKEKLVNDQKFELAAEKRDTERILLKELEKEKDNWKESQNKNRDIVTKDDVAEVIALMTKIPVDSISSDENNKLKMMSEKVKGVVIGQDDAVDKLVRAVKRARIGIKDHKKPIGSFIFLGPTGVGKTYMAKILAKELFGSEDSMIRIDMSEYGEKHNVSRLIGSPPC